MALIDALVLSDALATSASLDEALEAYVRGRRRHVAVYQAMSRLFTPFYQSDSRFLPLVRDWLIAPLSRTPPPAWSSG